MHLFFFRMRALAALISSSFVRGRGLSSFSSSPPFSCILLCRQDRPLLGQYFPISSARGFFGTSLSFFSSAVHGIKGDRESLSSPLPREVSSVRFFVPLQFWRASSWGFFPSYKGPLGKGGSTLALLFPPPGVCSFPSIIMKDGFPL